MSEASILVFTALVSAWVIRLSFMIAAGSAPPPSVLHR